MTDPWQVLDYASGPDTVRTTTWRRFWESPVSSPLTILSISFPCLMFLVAMNGGDGGGLMSTLDCLSIPMMAVVVAWVVRNVVRVLIAINGGFKDPPAKRIGRHTFVLPVVLLFTVVAIHDQWPMRVGFYFAKPAMECAIVAATPGKPPPAGWYGPYHVRKVSEGPSGRYFFILADEGWMDPEYLGFYYSPTATPPAYRSVGLRTNWFWTTSRYPEVDF